MAGGMWLVPGPRIKPVPEMEAWSPNHSTTREFTEHLSLSINIQKQTQGAWGSGLKKN